MPVDQEILKNNKKNKIKNIKKLPEQNSLNNDIKTINDLPKYKIDDEIDLPKLK